MKNIGFFLFAVLLLSLTACRKNVDEVSVNTDSPPTPTFLDDYTPTVDIVEGDLTGFVVNENNVPIENATVWLDDEMTTTDQFGHFFFTDTDLNAAGTVVRVEKEGYFKGSRRFLAVANTKNRVHIELITKGFSQNFDAATGGTINLNGGGSIEFPANAIQTADGNAYNGEVKIASYWLDPTAYRTTSQMPGNLLGVNSLGEEVVLGTLGMIAVELETASGEPLNILTGETAKVTTPIPATLLNSAPDEIPLWSYNEEFGLWVEEGVSSKVNGNYVAEVTHFSFWNHDFPNPLVTFSAIITDVDGNPLENYRVTISNPDNWLYGTGQTGSDGSITGLIPADVLLDLNISGYCNEILYSAEIGPFTDLVVDLGTIVIPASALNSTTVTGELIDCDANSIQNGVVIIEYGSGSIYEYVSGAPFSTTFTTCTGSPDMEMTGFDLTEQLESESIAITPNTVNDLGAVDVCGNILENLITVTVDGLTQVYVGATSGDSIDVTAITQMIPNQSNIGFFFGGHEVGDYSSDISFNVIDYNNNWSFYASPSLDVFEVTEYGNTGEPIKGNFSGMVTNVAVQPNVDVMVIGEFNVIRTF